MPETDVTSLSHKSSFFSPTESMMNEEQEEQDHLQSPAAVDTSWFDSSAHTIKSSAYSFDTSGGEMEADQALYGQQQINGTTTNNNNNNNRENSTTSTTTAATAAKNTKDVKDMHERNVIGWTKVGLFMSFFIAMILLTWGIYTFAQNQSQRSFENEFYNLASMAIVVSKRNVAGAMYAGAVSNMTTTAAASSSSSLVMVPANVFDDVLPIGSDSSMVVVLKTSLCNNEFVSSFGLDGSSGDVLYLGDVDAHDLKYSHMQVSGEILNIPDQSGGEQGAAACLDDRLILHVYPTTDMEDSYMSNNNNDPWVYVGFMLGAFGAMLVVFVIYELAVNRRQLYLTMRIVKREQKAANMFPEQIMARIYENEEVLQDRIHNLSERGATLLGSDDSDNTKIDNKVAELYLDTTVLYCNIEGFVAWASQREPGQIFILLETLFAAFDRQARRHSVFKVETIGDMYVAATGVPKEDPNHAVTMARFAKSIQDLSSRLTKELERKLGPDTGDLEVRIGIHSGNVTGGVMRGDRARYQIFGDTCNVASLVHQTGERRKIHVSASTARLLDEADKGSWLTQRDETVDLGAKGTMQTFWLRTREAMQRKKYKGRKGGSQASSSRYLMGFVEDGELTGLPGRDAAIGVTTDEKIRRLVDWNCEILAELLDRVLAARTPDTPVDEPSYLMRIESEFGCHKTVLEEFQEIITLPKTTSNDLFERTKSVGGGARLLFGAREQLHDLLSRVASLYRDNSFHNYEHAAHVTASVIKMMKRITDTDKARQKRRSSTGGGGDATAIQDLAGHSYGISSDPLTQFTVVLCAVIHDADHPGVPNAQLVQEESFLAKKYDKKSVAEQNSVDLFWDALMSPEYQELRNCIYTNEEELRRFRQLLVNIVMATDICDKELGALRKTRWNQAFSEEASHLVSPNDDVDRKATIVLEHLIQASDVSHTMQHWDVYIHWNERFFFECYGAYKAGRAATDPSVGWYKGEIGFFDFYIIPLAKKLESCGVFGVSSYEYKAYAEANRKLWEEKGQDVVQGFLDKFHAQADAVAVTVAEAVPSKVLATQSQDSSTSHSSLSEMGEDEEVEIEQEAENEEAADVELGL